MTDRAFFFDVNGVFVSYKPYIEKVLTVISSKYGNTYSPEEYLLLRGLPSVTYHSRLIPLLLYYPKEDLMALADYDDIFKADRLALSMYRRLPTEVKKTAQSLRYTMKRLSQSELPGKLYDDEDVFLLKQLREEAHVGLITNESDSTLANTIGELLPLFHTVTTPKIARTLKPHPRIYLHALTTAGTEANNALYLCDAPHDVIGSKAVGMRVYAVYTGIGKKSWLEQSGAEAVFPSLKAYLRFLMKG